MNINIFCISFLLAVFFHIFIAVIPIKFVVGYPEHIKKIELVFEKHKTENRAQNTEHRTQRTEHRTQRTENRTQRTENKEQRTEHRAQKIETLNPKSESQTPIPESQIPDLSPIETDVVEEGGIDIPTGEVYEEPYRVVEGIPEIRNDTREGVINNRRMPVTPIDSSIEAINRDKILREYQLKVQDKISKNQIYPYFAKENGIVGTATVNLSLDTEGNAIKYEIIESSGYKILDRAAIKAIEKASPFPPIPVDLNPKSFNAKIKIKIGFALDENLE